MLQDQTYLRIPGPTPIPPSVQRAMSQPMIGHRGAEAAQMIEEMKPSLQKVFGTQQDVMMITGSGTAGLETAVVNIVQPNEEVLVLATGAFGGRFAKICQAHHIRVNRLDTTWGQAFDLTKVKEILQQNKGIRAVFATYCETSTGVLNPIDKLAAVVREVSDALVIVDGVSCVGGVETQMDEWAIDVMITGSQKALMLPAGLCFISVSERAWQVIEANSHRGFYFDLTKYRDNLTKNTTPFTPALSLLFGLQQVLTLFEQEGLDNVYARHALMKDMTRAACKALDLPLLTTDKDASPTVTAVQPNDFDPEAFRKVIKQQFALTVAGGQEHLKGKIFRIGHMGYCSPADVLQTISMIEIGLTKVGKNIALGAGVRAAQEVYLTKGENA